MGVRTEDLGGVIVHFGDCREVMPTLSQVDSIVCDPPYHLTSIVKRFGKSDSAPAKSNGTTGVYGRASSGFMGQQWDGGDVAFDPETWRHCFNLLKPGGHLVAFSGTRTYHRMACAVEDAGFEIRDQLAWVYGSGFPKSHNLKGEHEGWGTGLKPSWEPIVLARKPLVGTVAQTVMQHGTGALNIDGCRVAAVDGYGENAVTQGVNTARTSYEHRRERRTFEPSQSGRWPANLIHDGSEEVVGMFPDVGLSSGGQSSKVGMHKFRGHEKPVNHDAPAPGFGDSGSAARFFYCAKADSDDRAGSRHPTVKPVDLMRWLVRLVTPKGGTVLDPFAGTGTTGQAALMEGMKAILIEREASYFVDIQNRMAKPIQLGGLV